jgi:prepilin-type processing-associated H-X9-DG protein
MDGFEQWIGSYTPCDCPPTWHSMGANFSYLDGHVEYRKWIGPVMKTVDCYDWFYSGGFGSLNFGGTLADQNDWNFIQTGITSAY